MNPTVQLKPDPNDPNSYRNMLIAERMEIQRVLTYTPCPPDAKRRMFQRVRRINQTLGISMPSIHTINKRE